MRSNFSFKMIQRIQSIYLLLSACVSIVLYCLTNIDFEKVRLLQKSVFIGIILSICLSLFSIFIYKNRIIQMYLGRFNILTNIYLLGVFIFHLLNSPEHTPVFQKSIEIFLPIFSIAFLALSNRAIRRDENLVKYADRIR